MDFSFGNRLPISKGEAVSNLDTRRCDKPERPPPRRSGAHTNEYANRQRKARRDPNDHHGAKRSTARQTRDYSVKTCGHIPDASIEDLGYLAGKKGVNGGISR